MGNYQEKPEQEVSESNASAPNTPTRERLPIQKGSDQSQLNANETEKKAKDHDSAQSDSESNDSPYTVKINSPTSTRRDANNQLEPFCASADSKTLSKYSIQIDTDQIDSLGTILNRHVPNKRNITVELDELGPSADQRRNIRIEADHLETIRTVLQNLRPNRQKFRIGTDNIESLTYILKSLASKRQNIPRGPESGDLNERTLNKHYMSTDTDLVNSGSTNNQSDTKKYKMRVESDQFETVASKSGSTTLNRRNIRIEFDRIDSFEAQLERLSSGRFYCPQNSDLNEQKMATQSKPFNVFHDSRHSKQFEPDSPPVYRERLSRYATHRDMDEIDLDRSIYDRQTTGKYDLPKDFDHFQPMDRGGNIQRDNYFRDAGHHDSRRLLRREPDYRQGLGEFDPIGYTATNSSHGTRRRELPFEPPDYRQGLGEFDPIGYTATNSSHRTRRRELPFEPPNMVYYRARPKQLGVLREEPVSYDPRDQWLLEREAESARHVQYRPVTRTYNLPNNPAGEQVRYTSNPEFDNRYYTRVEPNQKESLRSMSDREFRQRNTLRDEQYEPLSSIYCGTTPERSHILRHQDEPETDRAMFYRQSQNRHTFRHGESGYLESTGMKPYKTSSQFKAMDTDLDSSRQKSTEERLDKQRRSDDGRSVEYINDFVPNTYRTQLNPEDVAAFKSSFLRETDEHMANESLYGGSSKRNSIVEKDQLEQRNYLKAKSSSDYYKPEVDEIDVEFSNANLSRHNK